MVNQENMREPKRYLTAESKKYFDEAKGLHRVGDFDGAIAAYTRSIDLSPEASGAHYSRGNAWFSKREYTKALSDYIKALDLYFFRPFWIKFVAAPLFKLRKNKITLSAIVHWKMLVILLIGLSAYVIIVNVAGSNLTERRLSIYGYTPDNLVKANLAKADLVGVNLAGANLAGANLVRADFTGADLTGANFSYARLNGANFTHANLSYAVFDRTEFTDACFKGAIIKGIELPYYNKLPDPEINC